MDNLVDSSEVTVLARDLDAAHLVQLDAAKRMQLDVGVVLRHQVAEQLQTILVKLELLSSQLEAVTRSEGGVSLNCNRKQLARWNR
jgi:hypothetical protein